MLPRLDQKRAIDPLYQRFLDQLARSSFGGEIRLDYAARLVAATDNSVYQLVPQAVVLPRNESDVLEIARLAATETFRRVTLTPRAAGTGTNGGSLGDGICVDLSKHMTDISELDLAAGTVRVQPGVVLDQLNAYLRPHGVFFAPHVATADRATIGGMINNDSCGKGSRCYGRTSRHVRALRVVTLDGFVWSTHDLDDHQIETDEQLPPTVRNAARAVRCALDTDGDRIRASYPELDRFLTGYDLVHAVDDDDHIDLRAVLCGSEGTLGLVTEALLSLTPIPPHTALVAITYGSFDQALADSERLLDHGPTAIETMDETLLGLARGDLAWNDVAHFLDFPDGRALQLVELSDQSETALSSRLAEIVAASPTGSNAVVVPEANTAAVWNLRKRGAGLLGNLPGPRRPVPFVEDCAVPPRRLVPFIADFRAVLDRHGLRYGIYGHADVGCLHVRPALDLRQAEDERLLRSISDEVFALVQSYGGVFWGEHGRGFRSEYGPDAFGPELYRHMQRIKEAFDPHHQLNPGKVATPLSLDTRLHSVDDPPSRGSFDRQIGEHAQQRFESAIACNGNGACFSWDVRRPMCPSAKASGDRIHSPKGRAALMREWLRQLATAGFDTATTAEATSTVRRWLHGWTSTNDFSHEVYEAFDGCLACKACVAECPIHVDIPSFKAEFLERYHQRYPRSTADRVIAASETALPRLERWATLCNWLAQPVLARRMGLESPPPLAKRSATTRLAENPPVSPTHIDNQAQVALVPDAFTNFFEPDVFLAMHGLAAQLVRDVAVLPYRPSGKSLHVAGMLSDFAHCAKENHRQIEHRASHGYQLVCVEPAIALLFRQEYAGVGRALPVRLPQEWLLEHAPTRESRDDEPYVLLSHCTEATTAASSNRLWQQVFEAFGLRLEIPPLGCCGMAGAYGYRSKHLETSIAIYRASWQPLLEGLPPDRVLASGHSCRSQVARLSGFTPRHPVQVLLDALAPAS